VKLASKGMFERLSAGIVDEIEERIEHSTTSILENCQSLETVFQQYFHVFKENEVVLARNLFSTSLDVANSFEELLEQFCDLRNDSSRLD